MTVAIANALDYAHSHGAKTFALIVSTFTHILIAAAVTYAVLKIAL